MKLAGILFPTAFLIVGIAICASGLAADSPAGKGIVKGQVTYGGPIARVMVTLDGAITKTTKTDENGQFAFTDVPAGEYKLTAKGVAKNTNRKGSATLTMPEPPKELEITIKLE